MRVRVRHIQLVVRHTHRTSSQYHIDLIETVPPTLQQQQFCKVLSAP